VTAAGSLRNPETPRHAAIVRLTHWLTVLCFFALLADALHPQTLLTWAMNDGDLPVSFGGPLRMRVPRQLGYKNVKYITRITATDSGKAFGKGLGSALPEAGYAWYAGI
jgi:DMSO/TMAO reductase YedYZ molybdopterin-dependent catalytic subunit